MKTNACVDRGVHMFSLVDVLALLFPFVLWPINSLFERSHWDCCLICTSYIINPTLKSFPFDLYCWTFSRNASNAAAVNPGEHSTLLYLLKYVPLEDGRRMSSEHIRKLWANRNEASYWRVVRFQSICFRYFQTSNIARLPTVYFAKVEYEQIGTNIKNW